MGFYRFFLAVLVLLSHAGFTFFGYNPGIVAVISFFLLSGFVMTELIEKYYLHRRAVPAFYADRAARLFPQFLFYMLLTLLLVVTVQIDSPFLIHLTPFKWFLNFLMLPQGFFMYWADGALVMPQTWSLGLELSFYLVIPWIILYVRGRARLVLAALSFLVFVAAYWGVLNTDSFGYRLLPGTLYMFLAGAAFAHKDGQSRGLIGAVFAATLLLFVLAWYQPRLYALPYNKETLLGLLLGIAMLRFLKDLRLRPALARLDQLFGNLSYGVFLNHFLLIWVFQHFAGIATFDARSIAVLAACATVLALLSFVLVERPALGWRRSLRGKDLSGKNDLSSR